MTLSDLGQTHKRGVSGYTSKLLKTGQTTQYNDELDDGYYEKGVAKSYTVNDTGDQSGTTNVDLTHLVSDTGAFTSADKTYTDTGKCGVFKTGGGETIIISGSVSNNGTFTTASATADKVVFNETITDEPDAPLTTFKKREAISNNTVLDNNTGLTYLRYPSQKMGKFGNGLMPWTGEPYDIFAWASACNEAGVGGYTDWRVTNVYELIAICDYEAPNSFPDSTAFPTIISNIYYTSNTQSNNTTRRLAVDLSNGIIAYIATPTTTYCRVFLVRGG